MRAETDQGAVAADDAATLYAGRSSVGLAGDALRAFALAVPGLLFAWPPAEFVMLYTLQLGLALVLTAPIMFAADRKAMPVRGGAAELVLVVCVCAVFWLVALFIPLTAIWVLPVVAPGEPLFPGVFRLDALAWRELAVPLALLVALALWRGRSYAQAARAGRAPDLKRPFLHRAICLAAFVFFGTPVYQFLVSLGEAQVLDISPSAAIVLTYASCEAYPFVAVLIDRWRGHRSG